MWFTRQGDRWCPTCRFCAHCASAHVYISLEKEVIQTWTKPGAGDQPRNCIVRLCVYQRNRAKFWVQFPDAVIKTPKDCHRKFEALRKLSVILNGITITYKYQWRHKCSFSLPPPCLETFIGDHHGSLVLNLGSTLWPRMQDRITRSRVALGTFQAFWGHLLTTKSRKTEPLCFFRVYSMTACWKPIQGQSTRWHGCMSKSFKSARGHWIRREDRHKWMLSPQGFTSHPWGKSWEELETESMEEHYLLTYSLARAQLTFWYIPVPPAYGWCCPCPPPTSINNQDNLSETLDSGKPSVGVPFPQVTLYCVQLTMKTNQDTKLDLIANKSNPCELI